MLLTNKEFYKHLQQKINEKKIKININKIIKKTYNNLIFNKILKQTFQFNNINIVNIILKNWNKTIKKEIKECRRLKILYKGERCHIEKMHINEIIK